MTTQVSAAGGQQVERAVHIPPPHPPHSGAAGQRAHGSITGSDLQMSLPGDAEIAHDGGLARLQSGVPVGGLIQPQPAAELINFRVVGSRNVRHKLPPSISSMLVLATCISLIFGFRQKLAHFGARPLPNKTASLGFAGGPVTSANIFHAQFLPADSQYPH